MAAERVQLASEDAAKFSSLQIVEVEKEISLNIGKDGPVFQATSMVMEWFLMVVIISGKYHYIFIDVNHCLDKDSESISEVRDEKGHFEAVGMVFKLEEQVDVKLPSGVSLQKWLTLKDCNRKLEPPLVYILNHEEFTGNHEYRTGSAKDVETLKRTFGSLKCQVEVVQNPKKIDVTETINKLENTNFADLAGLVVIILSHGSEGEMILACDDEMYHLDKDVLDPICKIKSLRGKPKILIVQACKGGLKADAKPEEHGHYIKCYSTSEGYKAYRDLIEGSIYIQMLCKVMDKDALTKDFSDIIKDVNVRTKEESIRLRHKQVPSTDGMLNPFCFGHFVDLKN